MKIKKFESFTSGISKLEQLKVGDIILYQGSKYKVLEVDRFVAKLKSLQTDKVTLINQGQLDENEIKIV